MLGRLSGSGGYGSGLYCKRLGGGFFSLAALCFSSASTRALNHSPRPDDTAFHPFLLLALVRPSPFSHRNTQPRFCVSRPPSLISSFLVQLLSLALPPSSVACQSSPQSPPWKVSETPPPASDIFRTSQPPTIDVSQELLLTRLCHQQKRSPLSSSTMGQCSPGVAGCARCWHHAGSSPRHSQAPADSAPSMPPSAALRADPRPGPACARPGLPATTLRAPCSVGPSGWVGKTRWLIERAASIVGRPRHHG